MIHTEDRIIIHAPADKVRECVTALDTHARVLPEFQDAEVLERTANTMTFRKTARVRGIRFRWTSQATVHDDGRVEYVWLRGILKGMRTNWMVRAVEDGAELLITHDFTFPAPFVGDRIARSLVYPAFIHGAAQKTLSTMKEYLESQHDHGNNE